MTVTATRDGVCLTWESQVRQYPTTGRPGIEYVVVTIEVGRIVHEDTGQLFARRFDLAETLLYRNSKGAVVGIINYYPDGVDGFEEPGAFNIQVHPRRRRRGVGTTLLRAALHRWPAIDLEAQTYTTDGAAMVNRFLEKGLTTTPDRPKLQA